MTRLAPDRCRFGCHFRNHFQCPFQNPPDRMKTLSQIRLSQIRLRQVRLTRFHPARLLNRFPTNLIRIPIPKVTRLTSRLSRLSHPRQFPSLCRTGPYLPSRWKENSLGHFQSHRRCRYRCRHPLWRALAQLLPPRPTNPYDRCRHHSPPLARMARDQQPADRCQRIRGRVHFQQHHARPSWTGPEGRLANQNRPSNSPALREGFQHFERTVEAVQSQPRHRLAFPWPALKECPAQTWAAGAPA
jgi:hypothetical protein